MILINNVSLYLGKNKSKKILDNISLEIPKERITSFIGKSGAGKSSLLRCILNLENKYDGEIIYEEKTLKSLLNNERSKLIGFVFQNYNLFSNLTVLQNCLLPILINRKLSHDKAKEIAIKNLEDLGISGLINSYPNNLSGGQQQRVAIARALGLNPKIIILDEPTSALDPENTEILKNILLKLRSEGITIILSSQDMSFIKSIKDRIYLLDFGNVIEKFDTNNDILQANSRIYKLIN